jgi:hypothetical protein
MQLQFGLTAEQLAVISEELSAVRKLAVGKDGKMLVWKGDSGDSSAPSDARGSPSPAATQAPPPATYTPPHLAERIRAAEVTDGERKTITDLFAVLKGSTALIEGLDPEEARTIIDPALQLMMDAVRLCCAPVMAATLPSRLPIHFPLAFTRHKLRPCSKWQRRAWLA